MRRERGELFFGSLGIEGGLVFALGGRVRLGERVVVDVEHGLDDRTWV
ncbi:MAG: hypothetical protein MUE69_28505 [Myxococcota bacterium]|nr:hypothetical protein [Myxococcota bacterium]